jgi:hypothetical protein
MSTNVQPTGPELVASKDTGSRPTLRSREPGFPWWIMIGCAVFFAGNTMFEKVDQLLKTVGRLEAEMMEIKGILQQILERKG